MKNQFVKFSLTLVSAAVLAACSSSGGSDDSAKKAQQAEADRIAQQQKLEKEKAEADKKAAAEKAEADRKAEEQVKSTNEVGHKFVKKTSSNMNVGTGTTQTSDSSKTVTAMRIDLEPSLDTIVVAIPVDKDGKASTTAPSAYLEDFDFRGNVDNTEGIHTLQHIYRDGTGNAKGSTTAGKAVRQETKTKTTTAGFDLGTVVTYQKGRLNYTDYEGSDVAEKDKDKRTQAYLKNEKFPVTNNTSTTGTVAEVYGHRTFVQGDSLTGDEARTATNALNGELAIDNAPFTRLVSKTHERYADGKLDHVQYGRVTSTLHAVDQNNLKEGKKIGNYGTKVASFGTYGKTGTENHYFYRGVGETAYNENLAGKLAKDYFGKDVAQGNLQYQGHAVTYGLTHNFKQSDGIPNAIGYQQELVSGTHVTADVNLATKAVSGQLYDVWRYGSAIDSNPKVQRNTIAEFNGTLANNGSIAGTSTRVDQSGLTDAQKAGTFNANLFGTYAQELGGALSSTATSDKDSWGAVFGAKVQNTLYKAPVTPTTPTATPIPAWGESTDGIDTNSPIK